MLPRHRVILKKPFLLGQREVTVADFRKFVDATKHETDFQFGGDGRTTNQSGETTDVSWSNPGYTEFDDQYPVSYVSWFDAIAFCKWLSRTCDGRYRLPTEAEWEYACRAGTHTPWSFGNDFSRFSDYGWGSEVDGTDIDSPIRVASRKVNAFGLFDMHGNVSEWCRDAFEPNVYTVEPRIDPLSRGVGKVRPSSRRSVRGGNCCCLPWFQRAAVRTSRPPDFSSFFLGFRVVRALEE